MLPQPSVLPCPRGFDCSFLNSCPAFTLPCPSGYLCSSYTGNLHQDKISFHYAVLHELYNDADITYDNMYLYTDPQQAVQVRCVSNFFCENDKDISICPEGNWCAEQTIDPVACDDMSYCPEGSGYAVDVTNMLLALIFTVFTLIVSFALRRRQYKDNKIARNQLAGPSESAKGGQAGAHGRIDIAFQDITVEVSAQGKTLQILSKISGSIPGGQMTLMLGSTGCGKTTWLKTLRNGGSTAVQGTVQYWKHPGGRKSVEEDGITNPLLMAESSYPVLLGASELPKCVGYVPQEDILDRALTVQELLTYHAQCRLQCLSSVDEVVEGILKDLDIFHIRHAVIGGGENMSANISGGQLKRVNIACELVTLSSPAVLLLDEPTAGLDASVAFELIQTLQQLSLSKGVTIVAVLQQPRSEIFELMNHLFLMTTEGALMYEGQPATVRQHLLSQGHTPCSEDCTSDADFCIDVLNELKERESAHLSQVQEHSNSYQAFSLHRQSIFPSEASWPITKPSFDWECFHAAYWRSLSILTYLNIQRLCTVRFRNLPQLAVNLGIHVVMAFALAIGFSIMMTDSYLGVLNPPVAAALRPYYPSPMAAHNSRNVNDLGMSQLLFFMSGALGCAASLAAVPVFAGQQHLYAREQSSGVSVVSIALGRIIGDIFFVLLNGFVFAGIWCMFSMPGTYNQWLSVILATSFAASGIGYFAAVLASRNDASVFAVIFTFICCVFSGSEPSLRQVEMYPVISIPWYMSFGTWTAEATYVTWSTYLDADGNTETIQDGADVYGYDVSHGLVRSITALVAIGVGLRVLAMAVLVRKC